MATWKTSALILLLVATLAPSLAVAAGGTSEPHVEFEARIAPRRLPHTQPAPASLRLSMRVSAEPERPPPLREETILFDRHIAIDAKGVPVCRAQMIVGSGLTLQEVCPTAVLGRGHAEVEIKFPEQPPLYAPTPLTAYNTGVRDGHPSFIVAGKVEVPTPATFIVDEPDQVRRRRF